MDLRWPIVGLFAQKKSELEKNFEKELESLRQSKEMQQRLSKNIRQLAMPKATEHIVDEIEKLLK